MSNILHNYPLTLNKYNQPQSCVHCGCGITYKAEGKVFCGRPVCRRMRNRKLDEARYPEAAKIRSTLAEGVKNTDRLLGFVYSAFSLRINLKVKYKRGDHYLQILHDMNEDTYTVCLNRKSPNGYRVTTIHQSFGLALEDLSECVDAAILGQWH